MSGFLLLLPLAIAVFAAQDAVEPGEGDTPVEIHFDGIEGCPEANEFLENVRTRTRRVRLADGQEEATNLWIRLSRVRGSFQGELRILDERGGTDTRKVQGEDCRDVVQALSLTAVLALDPTADLAPPTTVADMDTPSPPAPEVAPPPTPPEPVVPSPPPAPRRPPPDSEWGVGIVGMTVLKGELHAGLSVSARKTLGAGAGFRPELGLAAAYARNDVLSSPSEVRSAYADMAATFCPVRWGAGAFSAQPCAMGRVGWLSVSGLHETHVRTAERLGVAAGLTLRLAVHLGHGISFEVEGGAVAPFVKRRFYASLPSNVVTQTPGIAPLVGVGLTYTP